MLWAAVLDEPKVVSTEGKDAVIKDGYEKPGNHFLISE